jgi:uncharacterized membrane protein YccF (DUF307 family)
MGLLIRGIWFLFIGVWLGPLWFVLSLLLMLSVIFFPIGAYTMSKTWAVMTLKRKPQKVVVEARDR